MSKDGAVLSSDKKTAERALRQRQRSIFLRSLNSEKVMHFMILPAFVVVLLFAYLPMYGLLTAFKNYDVFKGVWGSPWARNNGFEHFKDFLSSPNVWYVVRNTLVLAGLSLAIVTPLPVFFAMFLNEIRSRQFKRITQTMSYLPHFIPWVVVGGIMFAMFLPTRTSPVNRLLMLLGLADKPTDIMNYPDTIWFVFIFTEIWKNLGWESIIYLAVIASIDPNLYEAVEIDGGGRFTKMRHITWPALTSTFVILFILKCGRILSAAGFFDQSYILGTAANRSRSQVLDVYIIRVGLEQARYSFAAAVGFMKQIVNLLLLLAANYLSKRVSGKGLF